MSNIANRPVGRCPDSRNHFRHKILQLVFERTYKAALSFNEQQQKKNIHFRLEIKYLKILLIKIYARGLMFRRMLLYSDCSD